jgi:hypothetical protein
MGSRHLYCILAGFICSKSLQEVKLLEAKSNDSKKACSFSKLLHAVNSQICLVRQPVISIPLLLNQMSSVFQLTFVLLISLSLWL